MKIEKKTYPSPKGEITLYTLTNASGASVVLSSLGAGIVSVNVPDRDGKLGDVVLGYADPADYFYDGPCAGKVPGRFANRIARGHFTLAGKEYSLAINNGPNALHGGPEGFQNRIWDATTEGDAVVFSRVSPDGEENYPAEMKVKATYTWSDNNELHLKLEAEADGETIVNLTNHAYWNLEGNNAGSVLENELQLNCPAFLPTDETQIPTGEIAPVEGTPMDFTTMKPIGRDIRADFEPLKIGKGYDHCWTLTDWQEDQMREIAQLYSPKTGRLLTVTTNQPAAQVYTGNWLAGSPLNKDGRSYDDYDGVAIECQNYPDAPNHANFPSCVLRAGEHYERDIIFAFSVK
ncbi:MAG: galactose mutarotase [Clostridium sp.]|nr:galactose mutarotase [Clostridium sp.]